MVKDEPETYTIGAVLIVNESNKNKMKINCKYFICWVFFSVITAVFSLGQAAPHIQALSQARGAAFSLWEIIDTVNFLSKTWISIFRKHVIFSFSHQKLPLPIHEAWKKVI